jgi:hypothetical protein
MKYGEGKFNFYLDLYQDNARDILKTPSFDQQLPPTPLSVVARCKGPNPHIGRSMYSDVIKVNINKTFQ